MKTQITLIVSLLVLVIAACKKEKYEGCCGTDSVEFLVGNGKIYVPNIITPNFDGINDLLFIGGDTNIVKIANLKIKNGKGETIHTEENPNLHKIVWEFTSSDNVYQGIFKYSFEVESTDGTIETISGSACSYPFPNDKVTNFDNCELCKFFTQYDGNGGYDENAPSLETNFCH